MCDNESTNFQVPAKYAKVQTIEKVTETITKVISELRYGLVLFDESKVVADEFPENRDPLTYTQATTIPEEGAQTYAWIKIIHDVYTNSQFVFEVVEPDSGIGNFRDITIRALAYPYTLSPDLSNGAIEDPSCQIPLVDQPTQGTVLACKTFTSPGIYVMPVGKPNSDTVIYVQAKYADDLAMLDMGTKTLLDNKQRLKNAADRVLIRGMRVEFNQTPS